MILATGVLTHVILIGSGIVRPAFGTGPRASSNLASAVGSRIEWELSVPVALERAKAENRVIFLAINMDGERANDLMAGTLYRSPKIVELTKSTVNLVANREEHRDGMRDCARLGGIPCSAHRSVDVGMRGRGWVRPDPRGFVVAPQHVWIAPNGKVLISVPYQVSEAELVWCFHEALRIHDAESAPALPETAVQPARLIRGDVFDSARHRDRPSRNTPGSGAARNRPAPPTPEEVTALLENLRAVEKQTESTEAAFTPAVFDRLVRSDMTEAVEFIGARLAVTRGDRALSHAVRTAAVRTIGASSPPVWWKALEPLATDSSKHMRNEVAVAFEQLAALDSNRTVRNAYNRERDADVKKNWIRALGATAGDDTWSQRTLAKLATDSRDEAHRINAIAAILTLDPPGNIAHDALVEALGHESAATRQAAGCAIAILGEAELRDAVATRWSEEPDDSVREVLDEALRALDGDAGAVEGVTTRLRVLVGDKIPRDRGVFG